MIYTLPFQDIQPEDRARVGGKTYTLALLERSGFTVPAGLGVTVESYRAHVTATGLSGRIHMELGRKRFEDMRWEEIWDAALRIRNLFLKTPLPENLDRPLREAVSSRFGDLPTVVRSSAPGEDAAASSFAGLHESYVNVRGVNAVLEAVRKVWASLWSDAALLYRKELGLEVETSAMAVLIQEIAVGERSGVAFCRNPNNPAQAVVESVHGLNEGLVDGRVQPDQWILDRDTGRVLTHTAPVREFAVRPAPEGTLLEPLDREMRDRSPLSEEEVIRVFEAAMTAERLLGGPQDVEWTFCKDRLHLLQARPITTLGTESGEDQRPWYLSLRRSFENLKALRRRIEEEVLPGMASEADRLETVDPSALSNADLAAEIRRRKGILDRWTGVYWDECIPFAHGVRLFGHVYNDAVHPDDPFEFVALLDSGDMLSVGRNRALEALAAMVRKDPDLKALLRSGSDLDLPGGFQDALERYLDGYGDLSCHEASCTRDREDVIGLVRKLAEIEPERVPAGRPDRAGLEQRFLEAYGTGRRDEALEILDLARASYRLRDDDNLYLGRIEAQLLRAVDRGKERVRARLEEDTDRLGPEEAAAALLDPDFRPPSRETRAAPPTGLRVEPRQLVGQPAGPGLASGPARVVLSSKDLRALEPGEVLVCDAVDPNMTAVVPLAAAVVERRGGMLIHGAIIAREYGLPCVTGVPDATSRLRTGDVVTVDGFLGIVTLDRRRSEG